MVSATDRPARSFAEWTRAAKKRRVEWSCLPGFLEIARFNLLARQVQHRQETTCGIGKKSESTWPGH